MKFKFILTLCLIVLLNKNSVLASPFSADNLSRDPLSDLSPTGEIQEIFKLGSTYTDLQRQRRLAEIKGKVVQWVLPVYEVREEGDNCYEVVFTTAKVGKHQTVSVTAYVEPRTEQELRFIESLRTGDFVKVKGRLTGLTKPFSRSLIMFPATFLVSEPSLEGNSK